MLFAIVALDFPDSAPRRAQARADHLARAARLRTENRIHLAGPLKNPEQTTVLGSLIVADFADLVAAQTWAQADPYVSARVWQQLTVYPFQQVLP